EMQARPGGTPALPHLGESVAPTNGLPLFGEIRLVMGINRHIPVGVANDHHVAVTAQHIAEYDLPVGRCQDGSAAGGGELDAVVETAVPRPEPRGEFAFHRPGK